MFQSTRPVWGATDITSEIGTTYEFQSTRPVWGATPPVRILNSSTVVSIHAPRVGRDPVPNGMLLRRSTFQSTRPVWGATSRHSDSG